jgi:hypothetical protein
MRTERAMLDFLSWIIGLIGLILLAKAIVGSVAAGFGQARARMEGTAEPVDGASGDVTPVLRGSMLPYVGVALLLGCLLYQSLSRIGYFRPPGRVADEVATRGVMKSEEQMLADPVPAKAEDLDKFLERSEAQTAASLKRAELAKAKTRQREVAGVGHAVLEALAEWEQELDRWEAEVIALLDKDEGRALASQPHYVRRYRAMVKQERPGREELERIRAATKTLLEPVEAALANPADALVPDESVSSPFDGFLRRAREGRDATRTPRVQIRTLLAHAATEGKPGARTLRTAVEEQAAEEAIAATALVEAEEEKARRERESKLAAARREQIEAETKAEVDRIKAETEAKRVLGEQEARRITAEAEASRARMEQEAQASLAKQRKAQLEKAFEQQWPAMRPYLVAFTAPGFTQPRGREYERTSEKGPVSLGKLRGAGMLEKDVESLRTFHAITVINKMNDRDRGGFPDYSGPPSFEQNQELLRRIQDFLITYGEIMVEKGHLAP